MDTSQNNDPLAASISVSNHQGEDVNDRFIDDRLEWNMDVLNADQLTASQAEEVYNIQRFVISEMWGGRVQTRSRANERQSEAVDDEVEDADDDDDGSVAGAGDGGDSAEGQILHEVVDTREQTALNGRVRRCVSRVVLKGANDAVHNGRILDVVSSLFQKIEQLYDHHIVQNAKGEDQAQMILWTDSMETPISTPFRRFSDLTVDHLLTVVAKSQNSGVTISFKDKLTVDFVHIRCDSAWGSEPLDVNGGRGTLHLLYFGNEGKKRSLKTIADTGDNLCLAKCMVLGYVHCQLQHIRREVKKGNLQLRLQEHELADQYKKMGRKRASNIFLDSEVDKLYAAAGVPKTSPGNLDLVRHFEAALGVRVKVVSLKHQLKIIYKGDAAAGEKMIYLLYTEDPKSKQGHYTLITNIRGFYSKEFYCLACDEAYSNIYDHRCPDVAKWCYACYDRSCSSVPVSSCDLCKVPTCSAACAKRHRLASCKETWKCPRCRRKIKRKKVPDSASAGAQLRHATNEEMEASHNCDEYYCTECRDTVNDDHRCFIRKKELEDKLVKFIFYDFETDQSSGDHKVNFAHMKYFVRDPDDELRDEMVKKKARAAKYSEDDANPNECDVYDDSHLIDHTKWKGCWEEKSFKGPDALSDFLKFVSDKKFRDYTAIAHNMRGFDGIFILRELLQNGVIPDVIVKGQKIMVMKIPDLNVRFIDSFNFLPMSLAKLPGAFGLSCGTKGFFPHFFNTPENWNYVGVLPDPRFYGVDLMSIGERENFEKWYAEQVAQGAIFDFQAELQSYCEQDVNILAESCLAYRRIMCSETGCDPFAYLTCASVCNAVYNSKFMPSESIARVPPDGYPRARYSDVSCEWLEYLARFEGVDDLVHAGNSSAGEKKVGRYAVDGFSPSRNTVYEFYGCWFHGCPECFPDEKQLRNPDTRKLLKVSYQETKEREKFLVDSGYTVVTKWGCHWQKQKSEDPAVAEAVKSMDWVSPLNPRDAFFGGRTEAFKLTCSEGAMGYEDVTSLYPWVNFWMRYPIGHPEVVTHKFKSLDEYFGIVKCSVLPPKDLYIPVLPMHCGPNRKLIFPLCASCAESFQTSPCQHSDKERVITGTFFTEEVKLALEKGYQLVKMHSVWHFAEQSDRLFREYVKTFYKKKLLSSKLNFAGEAEVRAFMQAVLDREEIHIDDPSEFIENPGLRQLTKLMLNNLWGRYGMRQNLSKSVFISDVGPLVALLMDPTVEVQAVRVITDDAVQVIHRAKSDEFLPTAKGTNVFVAVATTAYARMKLYSELDKLRERALYCDTDSVIYKRSANPSENLVTGNFLGEMTDELDADDYIIDFVSGGPKNYGYVTAKGKVVVKVKGFTLNSVVSPAFSFENVKRVVVSGVVVPGDFPEAGSVGVGSASGAVVTGSQKKRKWCDVAVRVPLKCPKRRKLELESERKRLLQSHLETGNWQSAVVENRCISVHNACRIQRTTNWMVKRTAEQKVYSFCFDKRIILSNNDTIPYGYVGRLG